MRAEKEMMDLILSTAQQDDRVRAVCMNGSRTNPNAPKDLFQDYDIVYIVTEMESFKQTPAWIDRFGERIVMQKPDDSSIFPANEGRYAYLMQFMDGNRIDLTLLPIANLAAYLSEDKLTVCLLDKDGRIPKLAPPTDEDYRIKPPTAESFRDCCNEFWWVCPYIAKGLWRGEILYGLYHIEQAVRPMLLMMLEWLVGIRTDFSVSAGKCDKYLQQYLHPDEWDMLMDTYASGDYAAAWRATFAMCTLFRTAGHEVGAHFGYPYPEQDDMRVCAYLDDIRNLPSDASEIR